jgi:hypothetical protein
MKILKGAYRQHFKLRQISADLLSTTVTKVDKLARAALLKGYVVIAIDARFHGKRKIKGKSLRKIWNNLHYFGDKFAYPQMIVNTVIDNRKLVDWIATQPQLDANRITLAWV